MTVRELPLRIAASFRTRAALGLRPFTAPVIVFIPLGFVLGPGMLNLLSEAALVHLDIVVSIGLATLGVFIGIAVGREGVSSPRLFAAATLEACVTIVTVTVAVLVLLDVWRVPLDLSYELAALALGVCASASAAPWVALGDRTARQVAARVADLDDVVPILLGGIVLALAARADRPALLSTALTIALGLLIGLAGWLLVERAHGSAERAVFVLGSLALLGGAAAYLRLSPLLAGMTAGWFWVVAPGASDRVIGFELRKVQHPLVVLLLITAGAEMVTTMAGVWLFAPYVVFRFAGKVIGGWAGSHIAPAATPSDLGAYLISPGVIGIAFALNVQQVAGDGATPVVFAVAAGAVACEALAVIVMPAQEVA